MRALAQRFAMMLVIVMVGANSMWARGPATTEGKERLIAVSESLESEPLGSRAPADRKWALTLIIEVPDLGLKVCTVFMAPVLSSDYKYSKEVNLQTIIASGAFVYAHPEQAKDQDSVYLAGLNGSLRTHDAILLKKPKAHFAFLDDLLQKREKGELADFVREKKSECET